jgi:hypothetical protein
VLPEKLDEAAAQQIAVKQGVGVVVSALSLSAARFDTLAIAAPVTACVALTEIR